MRLSHTKLGYIFRIQFISGTIILRKRDKLKLTWIFNASQAQIQCFAVQIYIHHDLEDTSCSIAVIRKKKRFQRVNLQFQRKKVLSYSHEHTNNCFRE